MAKLPAIFFGHGSPMNAIEDNSYTRNWVEIVKTFPKPKAILCVSAHYETEGSRLTNNQKQKTIHDFGGFPQQLSQMQYNPSGDQKLVAKIRELIPEISADENWGLDHGTWSVLVHAFPEADIPTIQLSIDKKKSLREHYELAKLLRTLRDEGVLIIGSGNIVHNLRRINWQENVKNSWAIEFNESINNSLLAGDFESILNYENFSGAAESVPTTEHFIPSIYIVAQKDDGETISIFNDGIELSSIAMTSFIVR
ncbi:MAG: dioxygenase [Rickettsiaceae bacterium]|jgi:4,5-DOPA dioxygenase extradiol|nr:dioxygenase [Rickettsiaceae bacterium]